MDSLRWTSIDGLFYSFSVSSVWKTIRDRGNEVQWSYIVWSRYCIPRHAAHLWLVMRRRLKTQDRLKPWDVGEDVDLSALRCPLCKVQQDTHDHLFFACNYSSQVWSRVVQKADVPCFSPMWSDIMDWILPIASKNNVTSIVGRLVVAASSYYIWQERNNRLHSSGARNMEQLVNVILNIVRLKLASIKFKRNARVAKLKSTWNIAAD